MTFIIYNRYKWWKKKKQMFCVGCGEGGASSHPAVLSHDPVDAQMCNKKPSIGDRRRRAPAAVAQHRHSLRSA